MITRFVYDALSRRVVKTVCADENVVDEKIRFIYDGIDVIEEYLDVSGWTLDAKYVHGVGIDNVVSIERKDGAEWPRWYYHHDAIGSVTELTDANGAIVQAYEYDAWGNPTIFDPDDPELANPYLYTGRRWDAEIALYYYRARHYAPQLGRFIQTDPIGHAGGSNLYAYVRNCPTRFTDPLGLGLLEDIEECIDRCVERERAKYEASQEEYKRKIEQLKAQVQVLQDELTAALLDSAMPGMPGGFSSGGLVENAAGDFPDDVYDRAKEKMTASRRIGAPTPHEKAAQNVGIDPDAPGAGKSLSTHTGSKVGSFEVAEKYNAIVKMRGHYLATIATYEGWLEKLGPFDERAAYQKCRAECLKKFGLSLEDFYLLMVPRLEGLFGPAPDDGEGGDSGCPSTDCPEYMDVTPPGDWRWVRSEPVKGGCK